MTDFIEREEHRYLLENMQVICQTEHNYGRVCIAGLWGMDTLISVAVEGRG